jgi:hypothetical protein
METQINGVTYNIMIWDNDVVCEGLHQDLHFKNAFIKLREKLDREYYRFYGNHDYEEEYFNENYKESLPAFVKTLTPDWIDNHTLN